MFLLVLVLFVGGSYLIYRYNTVFNKAIFFRSPLFLSLTGTLLMLLLAIVVVNIFAPKKIETSYVINETNEVDTLELVNTDTSDHYLLSQNTKFHYEQIKATKNKYKYFSYYQSLASSYLHFSESTDREISSLGNFCLGVIASSDDKLDEAYGYFQKVKNRQLPYLHYCLGELLVVQEKIEEAKREYQLELQTVNGRQLLSFYKLIDLYEYDKDYDQLYKLLQHELADQNFPNKLARLTLLKAFDFDDYLLRIIKMVAYKINWIGFAAALLISITWLIYIYRLNVFGNVKLISLFGMFAGGLLCAPIVFLISDEINVFVDWSINGGFWNDLTYSIFFIGIPEEFVKMLPLLFLFLFSKKLDDTISYVILGSASALGFAFIENLLYFENLGNGIIHGRAYLSVIGHMVFTSFVAYSMVVALFKKNNPSKLQYLLPIGLFSAAVAHGLFDFLLFHEMTLLFFFFFVFVVQLWIIIINNCLNNSVHFSYKLTSGIERSRLFIALSLTAIFALEYMIVGFSSLAEIANIQLLQNSGIACFLIIFFSSNLSSYDLVKGYWRTVNFVDREKRGYGGRQARSLLTSWYFVNAVQSHNYVGLRILVYNDPYNKVLAEIMNGAYSGQITHRIVLLDEEISDPNWFLVKMTTHFPFANDRPDYILVKLRYQEDSLLYEDDVQVFFRSIPDAALLYETKPSKESFPFLGWAYIKLDISTNTPLPRDA